MISLILPYWERQEAADRALLWMWRSYADLDLEIIVVDDGSLTPFRHNLRIAPFRNLRVIRLPSKPGPKSPVTCWNEGVRAARGDIVVLSCIEIQHTTPILKALTKDLAPDEYRMAAAWCPEYQSWHTHSSVQVPECPKGTGLGFCAALHKDLYWKAGGFDEDYREGAGYEDRDFIHRLTKAGARFVHRDDLVVVHPKSGATIQWGAEKFARNETLFNTKWKPCVNIVCVNTGDYLGRGDEYVRILFDAVERNLPGGKYRYTCLTDKPGSLSNVDYQIVESRGWWAKVEMFRKGLFPDGERCIYFDLDTLIVGSLDRLLTYDGAFATLRDFYHSERLGPAVISWRAGCEAFLWDEWVRQGKPDNPMGDLWWINGLLGEMPVDTLQDIFPGMFCSFKAHCHPYPPKGTKVVCFHGLPRPHEVELEWVKQAWRVGGSQIADFDMLHNSTSEKVKQNIRANSKRKLPWLDLQPAHNGQVAIVAGGPSLKDSIGELRRRSLEDCTIVAVNGSAKFLQSHHIPVNWHVLMDARPENIKFIEPPIASHYWLSSQCDPSLFDLLAGQRVTLFHMNNAEAIEVVDRTAHFLSTGTTVALAAMGIVYTQGYRTIHCYGFDSSYTEEHHAYSQPLNDKDPVIQATAGGRTFKCAPWMVQQANEFQVLARQLAEDCTITVAGDGLLPHIAHQMALQEAA